MQRPSTQGTYHKKIAMLTGAGCQTNDACSNVHDEGQQH